MKKLLIILLGFCFAIPAFAAGVRAVDNDAWLDHLGQMQIIRQQILSLVTKPNATADDKVVLESLNAEFAAQKAEWDNYLVEVSQTTEAPKAVEEKLDKSCKRDSEKCKKDCSGKRLHKRSWKKSRKSCGENCADKCKKEQKEACKKACSKGKDCCQITGEKCTDPNCNSKKAQCKTVKKRWGRHVCGEECKNGCKFADKKCCDSAMRKEAGQCNRNTQKADDCCNSKKGCND